MKNKATIILMAMIIVISITPLVSAEQQTINMCEKKINTGGSWGQCNPSDPGTMAQGTFTYNNTGATLVFTAVATGLHGADGTKYALIYYKDTDTAHVLPSTKAVNVLDTATTSGGTVSFDGDVDIGSNIPALDDVNLRGKIWIVPVTEINTDLTLKWTGYANGAVMADYLFESDLIAETPGDGLTVRNRMGGIVYTYVTDNVIPASAQVLSCPLVGIVVNDTTPMTFTSLYPGVTSNIITRSLTVSGGIAGSSCANSVEMSIEGTEWVGVGSTMPKSITSVSIDDKEFIPLDTSQTMAASETPHDLGFKINIPAAAAPDTYQQTITITGIY